MPTALGQAYWVLRLWDAPWGRFTSYLCAWINTFGWWALTASQTAFMTSFLLGIKVMFAPEWTGASSGWVQFLVYLGVNALFTGFNLVACRKDKVLPLFNDFVGIGFVGLFVIMSLALLIAVGTKPGLDFQPGRFVFGAWINQTGWSDGVTVSSSFLILDPPAWRFRPDSRLAVVHWFAPGRLWPNSLRLGYSHG
jgi:choline transport protein